MSMLRFVAAALLVLPTPVVAQIVFQDAPGKVAPAKAAATSDRATKSDLDEIECRAEDVLGSRLERHKVCLTKEQWWLFEHEERERIQEWQIVGSSSH